ncbi:iron-siderophore ABC transporter substrate-binding protein [Paenibacillus eucommiae]|uniref:Iron complex transport system substrate-binding protein n=1 Tax=Paenibacillus eucommiae TaxID=1355755 RepID=A0ABS4J8F2_9BACL|nr:iron-siderophore ABC transporter substrate-binding protein [Paenibacillus eucommiae]MBP1996126.1 iron complex transport system substrate-binding protein [Paenibacillus eucommiae]
MKIRKHLCIALVIFLLSTITAACGGSAPVVSPTADASAKEPTESVGLYPRTISDAKTSSVELKAHPERIAVMDYVIFSHLVSLDYFPAAAKMFNSYITKMPAVKPLLKDREIIDLGEWEGINLEKTASVEPDLILASTADADKVYEHLGAIAPVVFFDPQKMGNTETDWKWGIREVAKVIAQEKKAEEVIIKTEQAMAENKPAFAAHSNESVVFSFYSDSRGGFVLQSYKAMRVYYEGLGLKPAIENDAMQTLSLEGMLELNPDHLFIFEADSGATEKEIEELKKNKVWHSLSAAKQNHVYFLDSSIGVMSPVNILYGIEEIDKAMNR